MKERDVRNIAEEVVDTQIRHRGLEVSALHLFDCPNCGHKTAATEVKIDTGREVEVYPYMYNKIPVKHNEIINGESCLTCGKQFTKLTAIKWEEWVKPK